MPWEAVTVVLAASAAIGAVIGMRMVLSNYYRRLWLRALELLDDAEQRAQSSDEKLRDLQARQMTRRVAETERALRARKMID